MIKFDFNKIKQKKFLVYDAMSLPGIKLLLKKNNYNIYYNRYEKINFWVLLKTIFSFNSINFRENYKINYIKSANPKIIITFIDNNSSFYNLKKKFPKIKTISIQNGNRTKEDFDELKKYKNLKSDYFFVFSKPVARKYKDYIKSKYIISGSIKCNHFKKIKLRKINEILYISQHNKDNTLPLNEEKIINLLQKIKKKYKINFKISLKKNIEKYFIEKFPDLKKNMFLKSVNTFSSYRYIQKYKLVIFINSTLGYEALGLGVSGLAIPIGCENFAWCKKNDIRKPERFGYPKKLPLNGFCWINKFNEQFVIKKIVKIFKNKKISKKRENFNIKDIMFYDYKNKKIKKILREI